MSEAVTERFYVSLVRKIRFWVFGVAINSLNCHTVPAPVCLTHKGAHDMHGNIAFAIFSNNQILLIITTKPPCGKFANQGIRHFLNKGLKKHIKKAPD